MKKLPPMNSLRVFEVVARSTNLDSAADELCITNSAISRHIKQLEDWLGNPLFDRSKRSLELTSNGKLYSEKISFALELIVQATHSLHVERETKGIGISTTHSIATRLLSEKLQRFYAKHGINISLSLEQKLTDFASSDIDIAIRCGTPPWPGLITLPLLQDRLIPVCHPDLVSANDLPLSEKDITNYTLLHDEDPNTQWQRWFSQLGSSSGDYRVGPCYPSCDVLIHAAVYKQGIALVSEQLSAAEIESGRLIQVNNKHVDLGYYFWLVIPEKSLQLPKIKAFCEWIYSELDLKMDIEMSTKLNPVHNF
jgi:LysR family glycine cleavage system transcriptional activator